MSKQLASVQIPFSYPSRHCSRGDRPRQIQLIALLLLLGCTQLAALPAAAKRDEGLPNPLEMTEPDPLLPEMVVDRPLSPQERQVLNSALEQLRSQAVAKLQAGDTQGAFDLFNRELRLRRYLGAEAEVKSLSEVGEVAWRQSQTTEVRVITQRLQVIQAEVEQQNPFNYDLLMEIASAYQKMRSRDPAVGLYGKLLATARQRQNVSEQQRILKTLADTHLAWFEYESAAAAYQELLTLVRQRGDRQSEISHLQALARIYQQDKKHARAIDVQQQLVKIYQQKQDLLQIPPLKLAMGDAYMLLERPDLAAANYQEAFSVARGTQQYGYASESLQRLADLYQALERPDDVMIVYQLMLDVQRQSYDTLGMMNTYDKIAQLHQARGNADQALTAYRQGLQIAQQLNYKVGYFVAQIEKISSP